MIARTGASTALALVCHTHLPGPCTAHLFLEDLFVLGSRHLLEELGGVEVRCIAYNTSYADVGIGEVLEEAEAKGDCIGEAVYVDLSACI